MTHAPSNQPDIRYELIADLSGAGSNPDPFSILHKKLRGRYTIAFLLALMLCAGCAMLGYVATKPNYRSTGMIRIAGERSAILYPTREYTAPSRIDSFVAAQATFLKSRLVLDAALNSPHLRESAWPRGNDGIALLEKTLEVKYKRGEQVIAVSVTHSDRILAQAAVNGILFAFNRGYHDPDQLSAEQKQTILAERERNLAVELEETRQRLLDTSDQIGLAAVTEKHRAKIRQVVDAEQKLTELAIARSARLNHDESDASIRNDLPDNSLADLHNQERSLISEIAAWRNKYGPRHPVIRTLLRRLDTVRIHMRLRERALAENPDTSASPSPERLPLAQLDELEVRYRALHEAAEAEAALLGQKRSALVAITEQEGDLLNRLEETRRRLDVIRIEGSRDQTERISIAAAADYPIRPHTDRRRGLAAAGAIFGLAAGFGIVLLIGTLDPRCRFAEDLEEVDEQTPIISVLPEITPDDPASDELAALGVHQMRNLLELNRHDSPGGVYAVSGAARGEGTTSLVLALGASFAAAGRKTLIIDANLERATLSKQLGMIQLPGLCEAIGPDHDAGEVHQTDREHLWAMPVGAAENLNPADLSHDRLGWLLDAIRSRFDAIIFDTGPVLTSVEAALVAAAADQTVLVVNRNRNRNLVRSCLDYLRQAGASCAGFAFNRVPLSDFAHLQTRIAEHQNTINFVPDTPRARTTVGRIEREQPAASPQRRAA